MAGHTPVRVAHALRDLGMHVRAWRQLRGLSQAQVGLRARVSEQTVRTVEAGTGSVSSENLLRIMLVVGVLDDMVTAIDPMESPLGRARAQDLLPKRVRKRASA